MRPPADARAIPLLLFVIGVLQPVPQSEALKAAESLARHAKTPVDEPALRSALQTLREEQLVWAVGRQTFSLTAGGSRALRKLGLHKVRDKQRLLELRNRAGLG